MLITKTCHYLWKRSNKGSSAPYLLCWKGFNLYSSIRVKSYTPFCQPRPGFLSPWRAPLYQLVTLFLQEPQLECLTARVSSFSDSMASFPRMYILTDYWKHKRIIALISVMFSLVTLGLFPQYIWLWMPLQPTTFDDIWHSLAHTCTQNLQQTTFTTMFFSKTLNEWK